LAALKNLSPARLKSERTAFGPLLETFVLGELLKLASWSAERREFFHFRDRYDNEVDIVIEDSRGHVVGIEVKAERARFAALTHRPDSFAWPVR
jgi:predicted AAA+ superfamily ATPase